MLLISIGNLAINGVGSVTRILQTFTMTRHFEYLFATMMIAIFAKLTDIEIP